MPGLFLLCKRQDEFEEEKLEALLKSLQDHEVKIILKKSDFILGYSRHDYYPMTVKKTKGRIYLFEGKEYDTDDGEYVKMEVDLDEGKISVATDPLGRLPLYFYESPEGFALVRDIKTLYPFFELHFNLKGIAEYLFFGYPLHRNTFFNEVKRTLPGFHIHIDLKTGGYKWSDENPLFEIRSERYNIEKLAESFLEGIAKRGNKKNFLFLSGGMDSRLVGAALHKSGIDFTPIFFVLKDGTYSEEKEIAELLSEEFGKKLSKFELASGGTYIKKLACLKDGLNSAGAFMLNLFEMLDEKEGVFFTGDGGDKVLPELRPPLKFKSLPSLIRYLIEENALINPLLFKNILKIDFGLEEDLSGLLESYGEVDLGNKYIHFLMMERTYRWLLEGEDRNRYFLWSTTPFYSNPFFSMAMRIPQREKRGYKLFAEMLKILAPSLLSIPYPKVGGNLTSFRAKRYFTGRKIALSMPGFLKGAIKRKWKKVIPFSPERYLSIDEFDNLLGGKLASELIDRKRLKKAIKERKINKAFGEVLLFFLYYFKSIETQI